MGLWGKDQLPLFLSVIGTADHKRKGWESWETSSTRECLAHVVTGIMVVSQFMGLS